MIPASSVLERGQGLLVVIDVQERLAAAMRYRDRVVTRASLLVRAAEIVGLPVVVTRQYPRGLGDLDESLAGTIADCEGTGCNVERVDKVDFNCFGESAFTHAVCVTGRRQLVLAGMETHICVTQTALAGLAEGFDVHVAADACCSRDDECHELALMRLAAAGSVITTAESAAYELVGRAGTDEFKALLAAVKSAGQ